MNSKKSDQTQIEALREKRKRLALARERADKRKRYGRTVVSKVNLAVGEIRTLDEFDVNRTLPVEFVRQPNLEDCPGLVAAYISEQKIGHVLTCCDETFGHKSGSIGFDEYEYVGTMYIESVTLKTLLNLAKLLHDSVYFCPDGFKGVILIDHYKVRGVPLDESFSFVVQGLELEKQLAPCFGAKLEGTGGGEEN
jgi:hypothetical protein